MTDEMHGAWERDQRQDHQIAIALAPLRNLADAFAGRRSGEAVEACIRALEEERAMAVRRWN